MIQGLTAGDAVPIEGMGFAKDFLEIAAEASDDETTDPQSKELKLLLKEYEKVDFGKLAGIDFNNSVVASPLPQPQNQPMTADFLFAPPSQVFPVAAQLQPQPQPANNYAPNLAFSNFSGNPSPKVAEALNNSNAWAKNFGKQSQTSNGDTMNQSKLAKKEVIESEGFLDF